MTIVVVAAVAAAGCAPSSLVQRERVFGRPTFASVDALTLALLPCRVRDCGIQGEPRDLPFIPRVWPATGCISAALAARQPFVVRYRGMTMVSGTETVFVGRRDIVHRIYEDWDVVNSAGLAQRVRPRLLNSAVHDRGPDASNEADRTAVPCTTYEATFDIGHLPPGDYKVQVSVRGIASGTFPLNVRTGSEPEVRDIYLQEKAKKTRDWDEFKQLQLERLRLDPTKAGALLELAQRSLESGTLDETNGYLGRAATTMEQNMREWAKLNPTDAQKQAPLAERSVAAVRALQRALPEYFAHRAQWHVTTDPTTGAYVIKTRDSDRVVRIIR